MCVCTVCVQIMQMTERGETPAGIQTVENRLSKDVGQLQASDSQPRAKPWEGGKGEGAVDGGQEVLPS